MLRRLVLLAGFALLLAVTAAADKGFDSQRKEKGECVYIRHPVCLTRLRDKAPPKTATYRAHWSDLCFRIWACCPLTHTYTGRVLLDGIVEVDDASLTDTAPVVAQPKQRRGPNKARTNSQVQVDMPGIDEGIVPIVSNGTDGVAQPYAVCGTDSLVTSSEAANCRIVSCWGTGASQQCYTCSAFKIGGRFLGSAGHCIHNRARGGFASTVQIYCTGSNTCNVARTAYATNFVTTNRWATKPDQNTGSPWDLAVIRANIALSGTAYSVAMYTSATTRNVRVIGYPAQNTGQPGCNKAAYAGACRQYSSSDTLLSALTSGGYYTSNTLDWCNGHSGSAIVDRNTGQVVGVVSASSVSPCLNYVAPQVNSNTVGVSCERSTGGASLICLRNVLPA